VGRGHGADGALHDHVESVGGVAFADDRLADRVGDDLRVLRERRERRGLEVREQGDAAEERLETAGLRREQGGHSGRRAYSIGRRDGACFSAETPLCIEGYTNPGARPRRKLFGWARRLLLSGARCRGMEMHITADDMRARGYPPIAIRLEGEDFSWS